MAQLRTALAVAGLAAALGIALGYWLGQPSSQVGERAPPASLSPSPALTAAAASAPRSRPAPSPMREAIRRAVEAAPVEGAPDLGAYLDSLEARAVAQRAVTALEVEPGIAMIRRHSPEPDQEAQAFTERMRQLQLSFDAPAPAARPTPIEVDRQLTRLIGQIERPESEASKQAAIASYLELSRGLDDEAREKSLRQLDMVAVAAPRAADPHAIETLWSAIGRAHDPEVRQALIRDYRELLQALPAEESDARLTALSEQYGSQRTTP